MEPALIRKAHVPATAMLQSQAGSQEICFKNMISPRPKITSNIWRYTTQKAKPQFACLKACFRLAWLLLPATPQAVGYSFCGRVENLTGGEELWSCPEALHLWKNHPQCMLTGRPARQLAFIMATPEQQHPHTPS